MAKTKHSGTFHGKSNALGHGGRAAQMKSQGVPGGVIGAIARREGAAPGGPHYHGGKSDHGKGAQPEFKGAKKMAHRGEESAYSEKAHGSRDERGGSPEAAMRAVKPPTVGKVPGGSSDGGGVNHEAEHGGNGMIKAMHAHANKMHPCG